MCALQTVADTNIVVVVNDNMTVINTINFLWQYCRAWICTIDTNATFDHENMRIMVSSLRMLGTV